MKSSKSVAVGHGISVIGAAVYIKLDSDQVVLTPDGADLIASQLHLWAEFARKWKSMPEEKIKADWLFMSEATDEDKITFICDMLDESK